MQAAIDKLFDSFYVVLFDLRYFGTYAITVIVASNVGIF